MVGGMFWFEELFSAVSHLVFASLIPYAKVCMSLCLGILMAVVIPYAKVYTSLCLGILMAVVLC